MQCIPYLVTKMLSSFGGSQYSRNSVVMLSSLQTVLQDTSTLSDTSDLCSSVRGSPARV